VKNGTGFTAQYFKENMEMYESPDTCPDELILFFHRLPYTYRLKSGKTIIQHIYDTHFEGVEQAKELREQWLSLKGKVDGLRFEHVLKVGGTDRTRQRMERRNQFIFLQENRHP